MDVVQVNVARNAQEQVRVVRVAFMLVQTHCRFSGKLSELCLGRKGWV